MIMFVRTLKGETTLQPELWRAGRMAFARAKWHWAIGDCGQPRTWILSTDYTEASVLHGSWGLSTSASLVGIVGGRLSAPGCTTQDLWRVGLKVSR